MADERRTSRKPGSPRGRSGSRGPRSAAQPAARTQRKQAQRERVAERAAATAEEKRRTRLTGRAAILVLVLAVLAVSYASSLRAYLQQRSQIDALQGQIAERKDAIEDLEQEKERWEDPAFVAQQARERFGYVPRGETPFIVVGEDGELLDSSSELSDPDEVVPTEQRAWYDDVWDSMKIAGDPPTRVPDPPKENIDPSREDLE